MEIKERHRRRLGAWHKKRQKETSMRLERNSNLALPGRYTEGISKRRMHCTDVSPRAESLRRSQVYMFTVRMAW
jgi:hypothetical protein